MDYFVNFIQYLLTICYEFGYSIGMKHGERKKYLTIAGFNCTCGSNSFYVFTKDVDFSKGMEQYSVIACEKCDSKYKSEGRDNSGNLVVYKQEAYSEDWILMNDRRVLN